MRIFSVVTGAATALVLLAGCATQADGFKEQLNNAGYQNVNVVEDYDGAGKKRRFDDYEGTGYVGNTKCTFKAEQDKRTTGYNVQTVNDKDYNLGQLTAAQVLNWAERNNVQCDPR